MNQSWIYRIQNPLKIAMHKTMYGQLSNLYICLELDFEGLPPWLPRCFNEWLLLCLLRCRSRCLWSPVFGLWSPRRPKNLNWIYFFQIIFYLKNNNLVIITFVFILIIILSGLSLQIRPVFALRFVWVQIPWKLKCLNN